MLSNQAQPFSHLTTQGVSMAECDIPVPGIPGPGNFAPFWMVPVPVPEKIGPGKKYWSRYRKKYWVPSQLLKVSQEDLEAFYV